MDVFSLPSDRSLNICMLSVHTCPLATLGGKETGGMNVYVRDLSRELARQGHQVDVFTRSQDACVPRVCHDLGDGAQVIHIPAGPEIPVSKETIYEHMPEFVARVQEFAQSNHRRYDVIHSHYWLSGVAAEELSQAWGGIPVIQMFHTLGHMKNQIAQAPHEYASQQRIDSEQAIMAFADRIVAGSPLDKAQMVWLYNADTHKIDVIPPGVDLARFRPIDPLEAKAQIGVPAEKRMVLFVGRIEPLKGIDTLLRAMKQVAEDCGGCEGLTVAIVGGDPSESEEQMTAEMARLHRLRAELGIEDLVTFLGKRDQDSLPYYYSAAEVVVMPSHYESFGMVALEAMACGTPVIASRVGGLKFAVVHGYTGLHVPVANPNALAGAITRVLKNDALRWELERNSRRIAQNYSWHNISCQVFDLYTAAIAARDASHRATREPLPAL
ncbi:MAG: glycosyltransferase [Anaerolineae bacterium]|nr:glycosyltransferase [Anaerolineae bacterium]MCB9132842.1 glycosyltransferase [Anaerolineales bacterium]MCB0234234.1 glycosyltransferase [Anaerolineae bacterium]MCB0239189.1 glycosyltransferase [Anaerolineae bacterium]MCB0243752.1 glycosyltransferase [Anaerolineae bacterium]